MAPPVVIIVTTVAIGVGVAFVVRHHVWPHVKPQAEELFRRFSDATQRRRERPYSSFPHSSTSDDGDEDDDKHSFDSNSRSGDADAHRPPFNDHDAPISSHWVQGLRRRPAAVNAPANERLLDFDVEMAQLDKNKASLYTPMTPTSTRPSSRGPAAPAAYDENPFVAEPALPLPSSIPLPLSPSSSLVAEAKASHTSPPVLSPGSASFITALSTPMPSTQQALSPAPSVQHPLASLPLTRESRLSSSRHRPSGSQSSNFAAAVLSPPIMSSSGIRSPVARATSPSGLSDTMSMVSAAPSRNWTDGGTVDIFSGSERDFNGQESDDDVRSVSDSGSWEELSNAQGVGSPSVSGAGRLGGR